MDAAALHGEQPAHAGAPARAALVRTAVNRPLKRKPGTLERGPGFRNALVVERSLSLADAGRLEPLRPLHDVELDLLSLGEAAEPVHLDRSVVAEDVLTPVVLGDEAEALCVVEPLHGTSRH